MWSKTHMPWFVRVLFEVLTVKTHFIDYPLPSMLSLFNKGHKSTQQSCKGFQNTFGELSAEPRQPKNGHQNGCVWVYLGHPSHQFGLSIIQEVNYENSILAAIPSPLRLLTTTFIQYTAKQL